MGTKRTLQINSTNVPKIIIIKRDTILHSLPPNYTLLPQIRQTWHLKNTFPF